NNNENFIETETKLILAGKVNSSKLAKLIDLILEEKIGSRQAKDMLAIIFNTGRDPEEILKTENMQTLTDDEYLYKIIEEVILENKSAVEDYKKGKESAIQFLVGKTMAKLKGRGNPIIIINKIKELLQ
ncbi:MAG: hypothetical protein ACPL3E_01755, partial [Minisyncoccia bacterium]